MDITALYHLVVKTWPIDADTYPELGEMPDTSVNIAFNFLGKHDLLEEIEVVARTATDLERTDHTGDKSSFFAPLADSLVIITQGHCLLANYKNADIRRFVFAITHSLLHYMKLVGKIAKECAQSNLTGKMPDRDVLNDVVSRMFSTTLRLAAILDISPDRLHTLVTERLTSPHALKEGE